MVQMPTNLKRFKDDLSKLISLGREMVFDVNIRTYDDPEQLKEEIQEAAKRLEGTFERNYQSWYSESLAVLKQLMPDRLEEFRHLYYGEGKRKKIDKFTYNIQDWLTGTRAPLMQYTDKKEFEDLVIVCNLFRIQLGILMSVEARFESSLFDIKQLVQADLFDSELDAARELVKNGFLRGGGAISGVVPEKHLAQVCANHSVCISKESTINNLNETLKSAAVLDVPSWRQIQRLGDIRNLCDHNKEREPTREEVVELIDGVQKLRKTLF